MDTLFARSLVFYRAWALWSVSAYDACKYPLLSLRNSLVKDNTYITFLNSTVLRQLKALSTFIPDNT